MELGHSRLNCCQQHQHLTWSPAQIPAAPLTIQLQANLPRKAAEHGPSLWPGLSGHYSHQEKASGCKISVSSSLFLPNKENKQTKTQKQTKLILLCNQCLDLFVPFTNVSTDFSVPIFRMQAYCFIIIHQEFPTVPQRRRRKEYAVVCIKGTIQNGKIKRSHFKDSRGRLCSSVARFRKWKAMIPS